MLLSFCRISFFAKMFLVMGSADGAPWSGMVYWTSPTAACDLDCRLLFSGSFGGLPVFSAFLVLFLAKVAWFGGLVALGLFDGSMISSTAAA